MIAYILNSTLCLLALFLIYNLLLANEKSYRFNRFYLLIALVLGLSLPSLDFFMGTNQFIVGPSENIAGIDAEKITAIKQAPTIFVTGNIFPESVEPQEFTAAVSAGTGTRFPMFTVLFFTYALISLILLSRFIYGIYSIYSRARKMDEVNLGRSKLMLSEQNIVPHSFMDAIFVNKYDYEEGMIRDQILDHEKAHINGKHTLDVLFVELLKVIFWFNPALYLFRRAILINHEFLADQKVIDKYEDVNDYQNQLLKVTENHARVNFASNLNFYLTKKRLLMMTKKRSFIRSSLKMAVLTPVVPLLILMFNTRVIDKDHLLGTYETELVADTVQVDENFSYSKWKTEDGSFFHGSNKLFDPQTGILKKESIYQDGNMIAHKSFNDFGQVWYRTVYEYENGLPVTKRTIISGDLMSEFIYPVPDNEYRGVQRYYTKDGSLQYEANFLSHSENYHGLVTEFDTEGNIIEQERYENGELIKKIK